MVQFASDKHYNVLIALCILRTNLFISQTVAWKKKRMRRLKRKRRKMRQRSK
ncbi:hypothetical protein KP509_30G000600 [Ceratopteris richardii]|uniref:60S ribosomal protein L41 n=1 Tax=Ceratopteris richardii TaxID=49495 RepID=A0A8T2R1H5_CERRI|nr:hypothetical protein KP509_30G000600 [Ceratopteris richardii]